MASLNGGPAARREGTLTQGPGCDPGNYSGYGGQQPSPATAHLVPDSPRARAGTPRAPPLRRALLCLDEVPLGEDVPPTCAVCREVRKGPRPSGMRVGVASVCDQ